MELTRKVITEKSPLFSRYPNPKDIPDELWIVCFNEIRGQLYTPTAITEYIALNILSPLLHKLDYSINIQYDPETFMPYREIRFNDKWKFRVPLEFISDLTGFYSSYTLLKDIVCLLWEYNARMNQNLEETILDEDLR